MATMRFHRFQIFLKPRQFLEFLVALALLLWSVTRYPIDEYVSRVPNYLLNPLVNFVIGNVIVMLLLLIYRRNNVGLNSGTNDFQYEYFQVMEVQETGVENKHIIEDIGDLVNVQSQFVSESIDKKGETDIVTENNKQIVENFDDAVSRVQYDLVTNTTTKKVQRFQRSKSEILDSEVHPLEKVSSGLLNYQGQVRTQGKLRRSESEITPKVVSSFETVDKLSSEEFNHTIEEYIAKHQRFLWAQKMNE